MTAVRFGFSGRFNDVIVVNNEILFRFPRYEWLATSLAREVAILRGISNRLGLSIPQATYECANPVGAEAFISYQMIPGTPLWREILESVDTQTLDALIAQLTSFLGRLHSVPPQEISQDLPNLDARERWSALYLAVREQLFPHMRPRNRVTVARHFEIFLDSSSSFTYVPTLRHGDPGPGNVLFDPASGQISGVIDFDFAGLGDPAVDWSVLLATTVYGDAFVQRFQSLYPVPEAIRSRAMFYQGTWAIQEALRRLQAGEREEFEREMGSFR
jgi:aminoglycoside 2''-phosphotransferase